MVRLRGATCRMAAGVWLAAVLAITAPARAQVEAGNGLLDGCLAANATTDVEACVAYVAAIADVMRNGNAIYGWSACPPGGLSPRRAYDAAMAFMRLRGDLRHYSASAVVAHALAGAFACARR